MSHIVIEMEKLNDLHCGLGQVCFHLGKKMSHFSKNISYYMPQDKRYLFPHHQNFLDVKKIHRKIPFTAPRADLWHCLHQDSEFFPRNKNAKVVLTIHDLNFLYEDKSEKIKKSLLAKLQKKIDRAHALTFVSQFTKEEVEKNLSTKNKITRVIYNGVSLDQEVIAKKPEKIGEGKFLFSIGTVVAKKNFHVLIDFIKKFEDQRIILAGWKESHYAKEIEKRIRNENLSEKFLLLGGVDESEKKWLYENCDAFLFPSLQEGFGLPVIEAMFYGKPTFISNYTSLPEIGGELAFYFDNFHAESMHEVFQKGMKFYNSDAEYGSKLRNHAESFSWDKAAKEYWSLYGDVVSV